MKNMSKQLKVVGMLRKKIRISKSWAGQIYLLVISTVWAADFKTPVGSSTFFFLLFLGQHQHK
jgi:hypothetical protein